MKAEDIFYSLTVEDIQNVAHDSVGRSLSEEEINRVIPIVEKRIAWYDIIDNAIGQALEAA